MFRNLSIILLVLLMTAYVVYEKRQSPSIAIGPEFECFSLAGQHYHIDPKLLYAIAMQESSLNPKAINWNTNKSKDVGLMQINSFWFSKIKEVGYSEKDLFDPCTNIFVGAWILSHSIKRYGNNWRAIGAYNAGTANTPQRDRLRHQYAKKVYAKYHAIK